MSYHESLLLQPPGSAKANLPTVTCGKPEVPMRLYEAQATQLALKHNGLTIETLLMDYQATRGLLRRKIKQDPLLEPRGLSLNSNTSL